MSEHTPGPWRWEFSPKSKRFQLCGGVPQFDLTVMDFCRYGFNGGAFRLREPEHDRLNLMHRADKWAAPLPGREHHASWFQVIAHPDALLIAAAPDLLAVCKAAVAYLQADVNVRSAGRADAATRALQAALLAAIAKAEGGAL